MERKADPVEYTIQKLAAMAGISTRTLRYYDEIGLLRPARIASSGYRIYGGSEVDRLQQILFYRELDVPLEQIRTIMNDSHFSGPDALREHRMQLLAQRQRLDRLIENLDQSIAALEGDSPMKDKDKFEGFKRSLVDENERKYGEEVRQKYGKEAVERSNARVMGLTEAQYAEVTRLADDLARTLADAFRTGDPAGELAQKAADLHRQWLCHFWEVYSPEGHAGLAQMYVDDPRFTAHYDKEQPGTAAFLRDAIVIYTGKIKDGKGGC